MKQTNKSPADGAEALGRYFHTTAMSDYYADLADPFHELALHIIDIAPPHPEREAGMRKLVEARDCFLRAMRSS